MARPASRPSRRPISRQWVALTHRRWMRPFVVEGDEVRFGAAVRVKRTYVEGENSGVMLEIVFEFSCVWPSTFVPTRNVCEVTFSQL